jgi:6-pyruvoyltetrahydropterin/6-carboxytetrahydropterin synthase
MWKISKKFEMAYGHRVHTQNLNNEFSCGAAPKCRMLHGHNAIIELSLRGQTLDNRGFVVDFVELNWFKKFIDDTLDHKFIIDKADPMFRNIIPHYVNGENIPAELPWKRKPEGYSIIDPNFFKTLYDKSLVEIYEGFVVVEFVPSSENLSKWLYDIAYNKMQTIGVEVESILFYETPKSSSMYERE